MNGQCISNNSMHEMCLCNNFSVGHWFTGPDCSTKNIPEDKAWADYATENDVAHNNARCSNMGKWDDTLGTCLCKAGWIGEACQRTICPGMSADTQGTMNSTVCTGRGRCVSMGELGSMQDDVRTFNAYTYSLWDADKIYGCLCDDGFEGYDCSKKACATGDDPLTTGQVDEVQIIDCLCETTCSGSFTVTFRGQTTASIPHDATGTLLQHELEKLNTIRRVSVAVVGSDDGAVCDNDGVSTAVTFTHNPGALPAMRVTSSLATSAAAATLAVQSSGTSGAQGGVSVTGTKENVACSNRGTCVDVAGPDEGTCWCHTGFEASDGAGAVGLRPDCGFQGGAVAACYGDLGSTQAIEVCNGQGTCGGAPEYVCTCSAGFKGPACEKKECPTGTSWFDEPTATDTAHTTVAECSNRGVCDSAAGSCTCAAGFMDGVTGSACERSGCGGASICLKGDCYSLTDLATRSEKADGDLRGVTYTGPWDAGKIYGCHCLHGSSAVSREAHGTGPFGVVTGYESYDCGYHTCPRGDNPRTLEGVHEKQTLVCTAWGGTFTLTFRQATTTAIAYDADAATVRAAVRTIVGRQPIGGGTDYETWAVHDATVVMTDSVGAASAVACDATGVSIEVTFLTTLGDLPEVVADVSLLVADPTTPFTAASVFWSESRKGTMENAMCGDQGFCDYRYGICKCLPGYDSSDGAGNYGLRGDCGHSLPYPNVFPEWGKAAGKKEAEEAF